MACVIIVTIAQHETNTSSCSNCNDKIVLSHLTDYNSINILSRRIKHSAVTLVG